MLSGIDRVMISGHPQAAEEEEEDGDGQQAAELAVAEQGVERLEDDVALVEERRPCRSARGAGRRFISSTAAWMARLTSRVLACPSL